MLFLSNSTGSARGKRRKHSSGIENVLLDNANIFLHWNNDIFCTIKTHKNIVYQKMNKKKKE